MTRRRAEEGGSFRGSFVFDPDATSAVKEQAKQTVKEAMEQTVANATEAELFHELALVLKEAKTFGVGDEDKKHYLRVEKAAQNIEAKYGYQYESEQLIGGWKLLFTTSEAYRSMGGMTGLSKAPGSKLHSLYQILRREDVPPTKFNEALRSLSSTDEAQAISEQEPEGTSATVEILEVFGGAKIKNEMRGIFIMDRIDEQGRKFTGVDQIVTEADSGGQENIPAPARALQICTYISSDDQLRISRSPQGTLFIFQRLEDIEETFDQMGVPKRGGSTWGKLFG
eukprot:CAMPEP_0184489660 /NCGR_PEP_ID=MMETSP0113_2-20130426/16049_1 /TAXON_ID=91329 /ORGANISM="Norrisiella sphaerica, Strain BC52" /LENGTH=282 /DNA_ID=CAMNT_0026873205 /DNA_START=340 /DNA_END=1188 /DNA_ORIENTATION=+